jgi:hypothetical protein
MSDRQWTPIPEISEHLLARAAKQGTPQSLMDCAACDRRARWVSPDDTERLCIPCYDNLEDAPFSGAIDKYLANAMAERARVIETAVEMALVDGRFGVLVETEMTAWGYKVTAGPDSSVPYGQIHEQST